MNRRASLMRLGILALGAVAAGCESDSSGTSQAEPRTEEETRRLYGGGPAGGGMGPESKKAKASKKPS